MMRPDWETGHGRRNRRGDEEDAITRRAIRKKGTKISMSRTRRKKKITDKLVEQPSRWNQRGEWEKAVVRGFR